MIATRKHHLYSCFIVPSLPHFRSPNPDYGNRENVALEKIRLLRPDFASLPSQAFLCALHGLPSAPNLKDKLSELTGNGEDSLWLRVMSVKDNKSQVILDTTEDPPDASQSINAQISAFLPTPPPGSGHRPPFLGGIVADAASTTTATSDQSAIERPATRSTPTPPPSHPQSQHQRQPEVASFRPAPPPLPTHRFPAQSSLEVSAEEVFVTFVNSPSEFYIQLSRDGDAVDAMMGELEAVVALARPMPFAALSVGMAVCAKYAEDDNWQVNGNTICRTNYEYFYEYEAFERHFEFFKLEKGSQGL